MTIHDALIGAAGWTALSALTAVSWNTLKRGAALAAALAEDAKCATCGEPVCDHSDVDYAGLAPRPDALMFPTVHE